MTETYTPALISRLLRDMPTERLATIHPYAFQMWPARKVAPFNVIKELISNEQSRRQSHG